MRMACPVSGASVTDGHESAWKLNSALLLLKLVQPAATPLSW
jgi:hypothetical protein